MSNRAVNFSLERGETIQVGKTVYRGANPVYFNISPPGLPAQFVKVKKGIPYVRVSN